MSEIRVILLCGSRFAIPAMQEMYFFKQLEVVAIPDYCVEMLEEVEALLTGSSINILRLDKNIYTDQLADAIEKHAINTGLVMTFPYKIPASVYTLPEKGFFNVHPGPLPGYRGADPIFQQIKNKETRAGVAIHKLSETLDTGEIVISEMIRLDKTDTYGLVNAKLAQSAALMIRSVLKLIAFDMTIHSRPQDEAKARYYKRQGAKDISIAWNNMDADSIIALINACNPWKKGAATKLNGKILRLIEAEKMDGVTPASIAAGTILNLGKNTMDISTIDGQSIRVHIISTDEGIFNAGRLAHLGVQSGARFEDI